MSGRRMVRVAALAAIGLLAACTSPEAERARGGEAGADVGNRDQLVRMHGGSVMYYKTPCVTTLPECTGPLPRPSALRTSES